MQMENKLHTRGLFPFQIINFKVVWTFITLNKECFLIANPFRNGFGAVMSIINPLISYSHEVPLSLQGTSV